MKALHGITRRAQKPGRISRIHQAGCIISTNNLQQQPHSKLNEHHLTFSAEASFSCSAFGHFGKAQRCARQAPQGGNGFPLSRCLLKVVLKQCDMDPLKHKMLSCLVCAGSEVQYGNTAGVEPSLRHTYLLASIETPGEKCTLLYKCKVLAVIPWPSWYTIHPNHKEKQHASFTAAVKQRGRSGSSATRV
jgi:hypothetical protein